MHEAEDLEIEEITLHEPEASPPNVQSAPDWTPSADSELELRSTSGKPVRFDEIAAFGDPVLPHDAITGQSAANVLAAEGIDRIWHDGSGGISDGTARLIVRTSQLEFARAAIARFPDLQTHLTGATSERKPWAWRGTSTAIGMTVAAALASTAAGDPLHRVLETEPVVDRRTRFDLPFVLSMTVERRTRVRKDLTTAAALDVIVYLAKTADDDETGILGRVWVVLDAP